MARPIRAFMMIRDGADDWVVSVCRDLEAVLGAWTARAHLGRTGVLHIGFDRPPSTSFEEVAKAYPGYLLLTASAKFGLPQGYEASAHAIDYVENLPIHVGTRGWGYTVEKEQLPAAARPHVPSLSQEASGWVASFLNVRPDLADAFAQAGIFDDASYLEAESKLPWEPRYRAGLFRFQFVIGNQNHDPFAIARAAPPWLEERSLETLGLTVRLTNIMASQDVKTVADIQKFELDRVLRVTENFGRKSADDLRDSLLSALDGGPLGAFAATEKVGTDDAKAEEAGASSLRVELRQTLAKLEGRERDILTKRMGFGRQAETLQAIADDYAVTRERVRQIESKLVKRLIKEADWHDRLSAKLDALLLGREFPLPVLGVEAVDKWFTGVSEWPEALRYILGSLCGDRIGIVEIDEVDYFGFMQQGEWEMALAEAGRIVRRGVTEKWTESHLNAVISPLIKETAREFRGLFCEKAANKCHFAENDNGQRVLIAYGRGADHVVEAVLSEAERPLHYSEIAKRASERQGRMVDIRRAHNAAASVGILLARGTYGLERHIELSEEESNFIREEAESVVLAGPEGRQWHSSEILSALLEQEVPLVSLDKYVLDFLLRDSKVLQDLGRMTWVEAHQSAATALDRIDIRQAIVSLIQEAGRPLTTSEIRQRIVAVRGVNETFQIPSVDPLIRLRTGLWGINDRDLPIKRSDQGTLIEELVETLNKTTRGIHISEIDSVAPQAWPHLTGEMIFSLAALDGQLRVSMGRYLYLEAWGSPRRDSLLEAVRNVLYGAKGPLMLEAIIALTEDRLERKQGKAGVSACLQSIGATFDSINRTWVLLTDEVNQADEDDFAAGRAAGRTQLPGAPPLFTARTSSGE